jgi:hypothetical protein
MGVTKELPVFITETGWRHDGQGDFGKSDANFAYAFEKVWNTENIAAVIPFLLSYKAEPFVEYSWLDIDGNPFSFYDEVKNIQKVDGEPKRVSDSKFLGNFYFPISQANHAAYGVLFVENTGQTIWEVGNYGVTNAELITQAEVEPYNKKLLFYRTQTPDEPGLLNRDLQIVREGEIVGDKSSIYLRVIKFVSIFRGLFRF